MRAQGSGESLNSARYKVRQTPRYSGHAGGGTIPADPPRVFWPGIRLHPCPMRSVWLDGPFRTGPSPRRTRYSAEQPHPASPDTTPRPGPERGRLSVGPGPIRAENAAPTHRAFAAPVPNAAPITFRKCFQGVSFWHAVFIPQKLQTECPIFGHSNYRQLA
jgi:hypothetical protein